MSIKSILMLLFIFVVSGCFTTDVVVTLNPDGSGTVEYATHFDRASDDLRAQIRRQMSESCTNTEHSKDNILEYYPAPHFKLMVHEENEELLTTRIVLWFADINALLSERKKAHLGLKSLDFKVDGDQLVFSLKEDKLAQPWPEKYDEHPALERISVVNAASGESVVFERELNSKSERADWSAPLAFPGHQIVRQQVQIFHDYPVVELPPVRITDAAWSLRNHYSWSALKVKLTAAFPADGQTYVRWDKPAVLSGGFLPQGALRFQEQGNSTRGQLEAGETQEIELAFAVPTSRVESLAASKVRLTTYRGRGQQEVEVGLLKPDTEYSFNGFTLKTDGLKSNRLGFRLTGETDRLSGALIKTKRGNRFALKRASWSDLSGEASRIYWELLPLGGCTLILELHNELEPCYLDLPIPALDLTQRSWRKDEASKNPDPEDWKAQLAAVHPELFGVLTPPVSALMFEDKTVYKAYFEAMDDTQLMPSIVQVVDYMIQHNPEKGQYWIQEVARKELGERTEYLEANREQLNQQLFALYCHTPEELICLSSFFSSLGLQQFSQPMAIEQVKQGNHRFTRESFYGSALSEQDVKVLKEAFAKTDEWIPKKQLLDILRNAKCADPYYLSAVFNDPSISEHIRSGLVAELAETMLDGRLWAQQVAADATEHAFVRRAAMWVLIQQDPFPSEALLAYMSDSESRNDAVGMLGSFMDGFLRKHEEDLTARLEMKAMLKPFVPLLEDLSEQLRSYDAEKAATVLEKVREL